MNFIIRCQLIGFINIYLFQKNGVYPLQLSNLVPTYISSIPTDPTNNYNNNYFPITKTFGSIECISYQLWTRFEQNNTYLESKRGFNSLILPNTPNSDPKSLYECGSGHDIAKTDASAGSLIYDVMP